jgi:hypothetical protein
VLTGLPDIPPHDDVGVGVDDLEAVHDTAASSRATRRAAGE